MLPHRDHAVFHLRRQEDTPAVFWHFYIIKLGPTLWIHADRCAQIHHAVLKILWDQIIPPIDIARMPFFQRFKHLAVLR